MTKAIRTDKPFEVEGRWWVPGKAKWKVPGVFRFDPKSAGSLSLSGSLTFTDQQSVFEKAFSTGLPQYDAILGYTIDGTLITLFDCWIQKPSHLTSIHLKEFFPRLSLRGRVLTAISR